MLFCERKKLLINPRIRNRDEDENIEPILRRLLYKVDGKPRRKIFL